MKNSKTKIAPDPSTREGRAEIMDNVLDKSADELMYLRDRWSDEKEYEDFNDYKTRITEFMQKLVPGVSVLSITKSFDITLKMPGFPYNLILTVRASSIGWKPIQPKR